MTATPPFVWSCRCGSVTMDVSAATGSRIVCYCRDCRGYARHLGATALLDPAGGTDLLQTVPHHLSLRSGARHLRCLRMTPRGPLRWYAACCDTPVANTAPSRQLPFASLSCAGIAPPDASGPVIARVFTEAATGPVPKGGGRPSAAIFPALFRMAVARVSGRHLANPFFGSDGAPVSPPRVLSPDERRAARDAAA